jgi:hypothetical protein
MLREILANRFAVFTDSKISIPGACVPGELFQRTGGDLPGSRHRVGLQVVGFHWLELLVTLQIIKKPQKAFAPSRASGRVRLVLIPVFFHPVFATGGIDMLGVPTVFAVVVATLGHGSHHSSPLLGYVEVIQDIFDMLMDVSPTVEVMDVSLLDQTDPVSKHSDVDSALAGYNLHVHRRSPVIT